MWFAARDIAFDVKSAEVDIEGMLAAHGLPASRGGS
jgi:hypothetical protein